MYDFSPMVPEIELRELRVFLTLAEELHFGRTGERLQIDRSRVSQVIATLETRIGGRLFERTSRRVRLTALGEQLRGNVAPVYEQLRREIALAHETATGVTGTLRIGSYSALLLGPHIAEIIAAFEARHPGAHATYLDTGTERDYLDWLRADEVDLVAAWLPVTDPEFAVGPVLLRDRRVLLVAPDHPLARRKTVEVEDLAGYAVTDVPSFNREMMDVLIPPVTPSGVRLRRKVSRTLEEALMCVARGEQVHPTVATVLDHYTHHSVLAIPFSDLGPSESVLVRRVADRSPKTLAFSQAAEEMLAGGQTPLRV